MQLRGNRASAKRFILILLLRFNNTLREPKRKYLTSLARENIARLLRAQALEPSKRLKAHKSLLEGESGQRSRLSN